MNSLYRKREEWTGHMERNMAKRQRKRPDALSPDSRCYKRLWPFSSHGCPIISYRPLRSCFVSTNSSGISFSNKFNRLISKVSFSSPRCYHSLCRFDLFTFCQGARIQSQGFKSPWWLRASCSDIPGLTFCSITYQQPSQSLVYIISKGRVIVISILCGSKK